MNTERIAPDRLFVPLPIETVREAAWQSLAAIGLRHLVIDVQRNTVTGWTAQSFLGGQGRNVTASFSPTNHGTVISMRAEPQIPGSIDFGASKRYAVQRLNDLERLFADGWSPVPTDSLAANQPMAAPIAAPTGEVAKRALPSNPVYGPAGPWPRGQAVLQYGIASLFCCQVAAPFAVWYGLRALREYGPNDPGDKGTVIVGLVLGVLGLAILLFWLVPILMAVFSNL